MAGAVGTGRFERRLRVRRFNCPLVFHRECKGQPGQPITDFWDVWRNALLTAKVGVGSSGRIRTYNPPVNSRMLYP